MSVEERCAKIIRLAEKAKQVEDERELRQLMNAIHVLSALFC